MKHLLTSHATVAGETERRHRICMFYDAVCERFPHHEPFQEVDDLIHEDAPLEYPCAIQFSVYEDPDDYLRFGLRYSALTEVIQEARQLTTRITSLGRLAGLPEVDPP